MLADCDECKISFITKSSRHNHIKRGHKFEMDRSYLKKLTRHLKKIKKRERMLASF